MYENRIVIVCVAFATQRVVHLRVDRYLALGHDVTVDDQPHRGQHLGSN